MDQLLLRTSPSNIQQYSILYPAKKFFFCYIRLYLFVRQKRRWSTSQRALRERTEAQTKI